MSDSRVSTRLSAGLSAVDYYEFLRREGCDFYAGVPDSLLSAFCTCVQDQMERQGLRQNFWITANEGAAVAMAIGHYLGQPRGTNSVPVVYLQNSGLGNTLNPIISMADPLVYSIPILLMVGWRGELGEGTEEVGKQRKDEPQHRKQGRVTIGWLQASGIPYAVLPAELAAAQEVTRNLLRRAKDEACPVALIVRKESFGAYPAPRAAAPALELEREAAIALLLDSLPAGPVVATTGMISRELFEQREKRGESHDKDFLVVGAMGHAAAIAQGLTLALQQQGADQFPVYCLDGDGSLLMHMGSLAIAGLAAGASLGRFKHIVLNNGAHDSVGGQPTVALALDMPALARTCGYRWADSCACAAELPDLLKSLLQAEGPALLEIKVKKGARKELGRPTLTPLEIKSQYQSYLASLRG